MPSLAHIERMVSLIIYLLSTGPRGCGKSTLLRLLRRLAEGENVTYKDASKILSRMRNSGTVLGDRLVAHKANAQPGDLVPPDLTFDSIVSWLQRAARVKRRDLIGLAGCPRHIDESYRWKAKFERLRVVHIHCSHEETLLGVRMRQKITGLIRDDETEEALERARAIYEKDVIRSLVPFGRQVLHLDHSIPVVEKLEAVIHHLSDIPRPVRAEWLKRLHTPTHPVAVEAARIDRKATRMRKLISIPAQN